jgi:hypothetical protein
MPYVINVNKTHSHSIHGNVAGIDDPVLVEALHRYHREKLVTNEIISQRLKADYGIHMGYVPSMMQLTLVIQFPLQRINRQKAPKGSWPSW